MAAPTALHWTSYAKCALVADGTMASSTLVDGSRCGTTHACTSGSLPHGSDDFQAMTEKRQPWWLWPLLVVLLPFVAVLGVVWLAAAVLLQLVVWFTWCSRGRYVLVVYSNSPIWQAYFEQNVLPAVGSRGVVLNWSERKRWPYSLSVALFRLFGGTREFNPLAIVFQPLAWPRRFRFYKAFMTFKHGRPEEAEKMRRELFKLLDDLAPAKETK